MSAPREMKDSQIFLQAARNIRLPYRWIQNELGVWEDPMAPVCALSSLLQVGWQENIRLNPEIEGMPQYGYQVKKTFFCNSEQHRLAALIYGLVEYPELTNGRDLYGLTVWNDTRGRTADQVASLLERMSRQIALMEAMARKSWEERHGAH